MNRTLILLAAVLAAALLLTPVPAQEEAAGDTGKAGNADEKITNLIKSYDEAFKDKAKRQKIVSTLYPLGEGAMARVETRAEEVKKRLEALKAQKKADPEADLAAALEKTAREEKQARALKEAMYMEILVNEVRALEKKYPDQSLVFVGQFTHMKKHGKRAVQGALLLMKDFNLHEDQHHYKAWEVLADLGDKSVLKELKDISEDFLMDDSIQLAAVYARSALGDTSGIQKKVKEYEDRIQDEPQRTLGYKLQIANIYYHGRMFKEAVKIYLPVIKYFDDILKERGSELDEKQVKGIQQNIANLCYNCACNLCLAKNLPGSYALLARCLKLDKEKGTYIKSILRDGDLRELRKNKAFKAWYDNAKKGEFPDVPPGAKMPPKKETGGEEDLHKS